MPAVAWELRSCRVAPQSLAAEAFLLSPNDLFDGVAKIPICWPLFFNYDIDADRLLTALKKLFVKYPLLCGRVKPHEDTRYFIEVNGACRFKQILMLWCCGAAGGSYQRE